MHKETDSNGCIKGLLAIKPNNTQQQLVSLQSVEAISQLNYPFEELGQRKLSKRRLKRQFSADAIKRNLLRSRESRRKVQLQEQTKSNIQMFIRIQAQQSHYQLKNTQKELPPELSFHKSKEERTIVARSNSQMSFRVRPSSSMQRLQDRCCQLKGGVLKEKKENQNARVQFQKDIHLNQKNKKEIVVKKKLRIFNKENQVANRADLHPNKRKCSEIEQKLLQKKLGRTLLNSKEFNSKVSKGIKGQSQQSARPQSPFTFKSNPNSMNLFTEVMSYGGQSMPQRKGIGP